MDESKIAVVATSSQDAGLKKTWTAPTLTKLKVEDAESGNNISENGATGS